MAERDYGGPAFPTKDFYRGMSLRDYFAGQALAGLLAACRELQESIAATAAEAEVGPTRMTAINAYEIADAMLAERSK